MVSEFFHYHHLENYSPLQPLTSLKIVQDSLSLAIIYQPLLPTLLRVSTTQSIHLSFGCSVLLTLFQFTFHNPCGQYKYLSKFLTKNN